MKFIIVVLVAAALSACCRKGNNEPYYEDVCIQEELNFMPITTMINNNPTVHLQPYYTCVKTELRCIVPEGSKTEFCPPVEAK